MVPTAAGKEVGAGGSNPVGRAECVCGNGIARRTAPRRQARQQHDAALRLRRMLVALASHFDINLYEPGQIRREMSGW